MEEKSAMKCVFHVVYRSRQNGYQHIVKNEKEYRIFQSEHLVRHLKINWKIKQKPEIGIATHPQKYH